MSVPLQPTASELRQAWLGDTRVDFTAHAITRGDVELRLTPKACAVLRELVLRDNRVVRRDDLLGLVWPDSFPTDDVLTRAVRELRAALDDNPRAPTLIQTIPRVGYRLNMPVRFVAPAEAEYRGVPATAAVNDAEGVSEIAATPPIAAIDVAIAAPRPRRWPWFAAVGLIGLGLIAYAITRDTRQAREQPATATRLVASEPVTLTADPGTEYFPAISPDGALIAYVGAAPNQVDAALMMKSRDPAAQAVVLVPARPHSFMAHPVWSTDGTRLLYAQIDDSGCALRVVPVTGGTPRTIAPCDHRVMDGFDWSPDDRTIYLSAPRANEGTGARALMALDLASGQQRALDYAPRVPGDVDLYPRASPDGRWLAFRRGVRPYSDVWLMPLQGGQARLLARLGSRQQGMAWLADSSGLVVSSDHGGPQSLHRIDIATGAVSALGVDDARYPAIARRAGYLVFDRDLQLTQLVAFELDAQGKPGAGQVISPASRSDYGMSLSPSGARVAFVSERSGRPQIWVHEFATASLRLLSNTTDATPDFPEWSPDEKHLIYIERGQGSSTLMRVDLDSGRGTALNHGDERIRFGSYSADGQSIFYSSDREDGWQVWRMAVDGGAAKRISRDGGLDPRQFSGDAHVYYCKVSMSGLFRIDPDSGVEEPVTLHASLLARGAYRVVGDRLWVYEQTEVDSAQMMVRPLAGGFDADDKFQATATLRLPGTNPLPMASFNSARSRIVVNMVTRDGADVYVTSLSNAPKP